MKTEHYKLGLKPRRAGVKRAQLGHFLDLESLPLAPEKVYYEFKVRNWPLLKNDSLGNCTAAGVAHSLQNAVAHSTNSLKFTPTDDMTVDFYSATTGYNPANPATDQGGDEDQVLAYLLKKGFAGYNLLGYVEIDPQNIEHVKQAITYFGSVYTGIALPLSAQNQSTWSAEDDASLSWMKRMAQFFGRSHGGNTAPGSWGGHCLAAETKIPLLDGTERSIESLVDSQPYLYSVDESGNIQAGRAQRVWKTGIRKLIRVTLDNNASFDCTPEHLVMTREGSYRPAGTLQAGDSLMPLYRDLNPEGYEETYNPATDEFRATHLLVAHGAHKVPHGFVYHHRDFNKRNNRPDNLRFMTFHGHTKLHNEQASLLHDYAKSPEGRAKSSELMSKLWADPVWRADRVRKNADNGSRTMRKLHAEGQRPGIQSYSHEDRSRIAAENHARLGANHPMHSAESQEKHGATLRNRLNSDPEFRSKQADTSRRNLAGYNEALKSGAVRLTERQIAARRANALALNARANHKVLKIEELGGEHAVYDISVPEFQNFAVGAGVFVHNCTVCPGYGADGLQNVTWGQLLPMTWDFWRKYATSCYALLWSDWVSYPMLKSLGFDLAALQAAQKQLAQ